MKVARSRALLWLLATLALALASAPGSAGAAPDEAAADEAAADDPAADDACGRDRRCRIERLAARNRDRRLLAGLKRDDRIARLHELLAEEVLPTRLRAPWLVAVRLERLGAVAGWTVLPHLQVEVGISGLDQYTSSVSAPNVSGGGRLELTVLEVSAVAFLSTGMLSPYASVGGAYMWGSGSSWMTRWETGESSSSDTGIVVHALRFAAGLDLLALDRAHLRLGLVYQPDIYRQARVAPGVYDQATRDSLGRWLKDDLRLHPEIRLGFAFHL